MDTICVAPAFGLVGQDQRFSEPGRNQLISGYLPGAEPGDLFQRFDRDTRAGDGATGFKDYISLRIIFR